METSKMIVFRKRYGDTISERLWEKKETLDRCGFGYLSYYSFYVINLYGNVSK